MPERQFEITLNIPADEYLRMYRGEAETILALDTRGIPIQFPAAALRPFVTREGIHGKFLIRVDAASKLLDVQQVSA